MNPPFMTSDGNSANKKIRCVIQQKNTARTRSTIAVSQVTQETGFSLISDYSELRSKLGGVLDHVQENLFANLVPIASVLFLVLFGMELRLWWVK